LQSRHDLLIVLGHFFLPYPSARTLTPARSMIFLLTHAIWSGFSEIIARLPAANSARRSFYGSHANNQILTMLAAMSKPPGRVVAGIFSGSFLCGGIVGKGREFRRKYFRSARFTASRSDVQNLFKPPVPSRLHSARLNLEKLCLQQVGDMSVELAGSITGELGFLLGSRRERVKHSSFIPHPAKNTLSAGPMRETPPPSTLRLPAD
jgi:hypothetical protein